MNPRLSRRDLVRRLVAPGSVPATATAAGAAIGSSPIPRDHHLLARATFGRNERSYADLRRLGVAAWIDAQLDYMAIDDSAAQRAAETVIEGFRAAGADVRMLTYAIYSRRQLAWRMTHFLNNHFATYRGSTQGISETVEDEQFFKHCFTDFRTVLRVSATSPAMIDFLDSANNIAASPNENYARELMELHTLGVGGGYTESDVAEAARIFTGWARSNVRPAGAGTPVTLSYFRFRGGQHDSLPKSISLGWSTPGVRGRTGYQEGFDFLDFLAAHPSTAQRFCDKLCRYFVADTPPPSLVARVRQAFRTSGGDFKVTLRALFHDPEFYDPSAVREKVCDGFEFVANVCRRLEIPAANVRRLNNDIGKLGGQPHQFPVPTGLPEVGLAWQGAGNLLPRWTFVDALLHNGINGVRVDWNALFKQDPGSGDAWVKFLLARLIDHDVPESTSVMLTSFMDARLATLPANPPMSRVLPHVRDLASLILRLPEAQLS